MPSSALVIGATGATGKHVLKELLSSPTFTRVGEYGRRVTPADQLGGTHDKLEQKTIDFEKIDEAGLKEGKWDVVFIALGTTRAAAGSAAAFEKIDREYVLNAARAAKVDGTHPQRLVYLSSTSADASSSFLYPRSKGLTENGLAALGYSDTIVFRPGFLQKAERGHTRIGEAIFSPIAAAASYVFPGAAIDVDLLAKSMRLAGQLGSAALPPVAEAFKAGPEGASFTVIGNKGAAALAKTEA